MKNKKLLMLGSAIVTLSSLVAASRAKATTAAMNMSAVIIAPIVLTAAQTLFWGTLTGTAGGNATVAVDGTYGGTVTQVAGVSTQGQITVNAATAIPIIFSAPASDTVDDAGAGAPMTVDQFRFRINGVTGAAGAALTNSIAASPSTLDVGGRLTVAAAQAAGTYTGAVTITANYQ